MIVVTHLLGTGHLTRAMTLAHAFEGAGHSVTLVSGGVRPARLDIGGIDFVQLPPVRSDGVDFTRLLDAQGAVCTPAQLQSRENTLAGTLRKTRPHALITELFPFGRRILRAEFTTLLQTAQALDKQLRIFASIRDILAPPSKPSKASFADEMVAHFYDAVLVHADETVTPLSLSWPVSDILRPRLAYTGFVAPPPVLDHPQRVGQGEVLISAGGGDVGKALFSCAKAAAAKDLSRIWRLLVGGADPAAYCADMARTAPRNLIIEPARPDFRQMLRHAAVSVSLCGYNTALDLLQTDCPAVFVPFDEGNETEQGIRATALATRPGMAVLRAAALTPEGLLSHIDKVIAQGRGVDGAVDMDGAQVTVRIVERTCGGRDAG